MKKSFVITMILLAGVFAFTSCDKTEDVEPGTNPTATLKGKVYADLDQTETGNEMVPSGTEIYFRIDAADLVLTPQSGYSYQTLQYKATVDANGEYSIDLPSANHQAVNVYISPNQFKYNVQVTTEDTNEHVFDAGTMTVSTMADQTYFVDIMYY
jgi:hypothetical protein